MSMSSGLPASLAGLERMATDLSGLAGQVDRVEKGLLTKITKPPTGTPNGAVLAADDTQPGLVAWTPQPFQVISERATRASSSLGTTAFVIGNGGAAHYYGTAGAAATAFYLDPADWGPNGVVMRLRCWCQTEIDPTDSTLQAQVGRITSVGATGTIGGAATVTTLSDVSMSVTAANTQYMDIGVDTTVTTAGYLFVVFVHGTNPLQAMSYGYTLMGRAA